MNKSICINIVVSDAEASLSDSEEWLGEMALEISEGLMGHLEKLEIKYGS